MKLTLFWSGLACGITVTLLAVNALPQPSVAADEKPQASVEDVQDESAGSDKPMVYELRTYYTHDGRLDALHARFRDHTMKLFEKHGIKNIIYTTPTDKDNTLVYLIAHESEEAAAASWKAFAGDPEWKKVAEESQRDGRIVEKVERMYLNPTDYSPMK